MCPIPSLEFNVRITRREIFITKWLVAVLATVYLSISVSSHYANRSPSVLRLHSIIVEDGPPFLETGYENGNGKVLSVYCPVRDM